MAETVRLLRLSLTLLLLQSIFTGVFVTSTDDNHAKDRGPLEAAGLVCSHGICFEKEDYRYQTARSPQYMDCRDLRGDCEIWGEQGLCETDNRYMHSLCPQTCRTCHNRTMRVPASQAFSPPPKVTNRKRKIVSVVGSDIGIPQVMGDMPDRVLRRVKKARAYLQGTVMVEDRYEPVRTLCRNLHESCAEWAARNECSNNEDYMKIHCAPVCFSCQELHVNAKCPPPADDEAENAWEVGDLNRMFERLTTDPSMVQQYTPTVLSRPSYAPGDTAETVNYQLGPWIIMLDNFISPQEADRMIEAGHELGYERSKDVVAVHKDGSFDDAVSEDRTSTNAWCIEPSCAEDPMLLDVLARIETVTQIPLANAESLQLLRYEEGQYYKIHHDYIRHEQQSMQGPRILTAFLYLNDVEEGGGTNFSELDITVEPKLGRALLWPSVKDDDPHQFDPRAYHQALPVVRGIKYASNVWLHLRDVVTPLEMGC